MDRFTITSEHIERAVETVSDFMRKYRVEQKDILRLTLALEDTLLNYRDTFGEETDCTLNCIHRFGRLRIELSVSGRSCDPFASGDEEDFSRLLLSGMGMAPVWQYKNGWNIVTFTPRKKKPSQMVYILAAVALALVCGAASRLLPQSVQTIITEQLLLPISDAFLGLMNGVAGIMIFLSLVWSICGIGDMAMLTSIGRKMLSRMLLMLILLPTVFLLCILPLFEISSGAGTGAVDLSGPVSMLLGMVPASLISPFVEGNFLQITFVAAIVGVALLALGGKVSLIVSFVEQVSALIQLILEVICSFISIVIFIMVYNMVLTGSFTVLLEAYKAPLLMAVGCLFVMGVYVCLICAKHKVSPAVLLKKALPSFLIGLTTASSSAAMSTVMETCDKQYGIDKKIVNFGVPLSQIIYGMGSVIDFVVLSICMAELCGVALTPMWLVMVVFVSILLTVATPPVAGGGVALCTILFNQLGIPMEGLAIAVAINVIVEFFVTATNVFCRQAELIVLSGKLNMLDEDILRRKQK